jgi:hypothetical protein
MTRESKIHVNKDEISFIEEISYGEKDYSTYGGYNRIVFKTGHEIICKLSEEDIRRLS